MCGISGKDCKVLLGWREGSFNHSSGGAGARMSPNVMLAELNTGERGTKEILLGTSQPPPRKPLPAGF